MKKMFLGLVVDGGGGFGVHGLAVVVDEEDVGFAGKSKAKQDSRTNSGPELQGERHTTYVREWEQRQKQLWHQRAVAGEVERKQKLKQMQQVQQRAST
ncbi:hypothetical protein Q3G72_032077 [Acer saccharum]|nr:hypothetical protein Q3G72_032077 [Acer saccharum]